MLAHSGRTWHSQKRTNKWEGNQKKSARNMHTIWVDGTIETHNNDTHSTHHGIGSERSPKHFTLVHLRNDKLEKFILAVRRCCAVCFFILPPSTSAEHFCYIRCCHAFPEAMDGIQWEFRLGSALLLLSSTPSSLCHLNQSRNDKNLMNFLGTFQVSFVGISLVVCSGFSRNDAPDWRVDNFNGAIKQ